MTEGAAAAPAGAVTAGLPSQRARRQLLAASFFSSLPRVNDGI